MSKGLLVALLSSFLPCFATLAGEPAELPFQFADGFLRVEVRVDASPKPLSMLLDSGASVSVMSRATASRLNIPLGAPLSIQGVAADASAYEIDPLPAAISGIESGEIALAADMSHANDLCAQPIDGLIGIDFFRDRIVQIDYARQCLRLLPRSPERKDALRLPLKLINDVLCVSVGVNGSSTRWTRLDTGCNDALHWVIPKRTRRGAAHAASIGFVTDTRNVVPTRVTLGSRVFSSVPTALHGRPFFVGEAGLVGNGLLSRFLVTVDWPTGTLILENAE